MPETPKRLCLALIPSTAFADPGMYKANEAGNINTVLRHIHVSSVYNGTVWFHLTISPAGGVDDWNRRIFSEAYIGPYGSLDWTGFMVMNPNDFLGAQAQVANALTLTVSGIVVT